MPKIKREEIHIIGRNSNWSKEGIEKTLKEEVYSTKSSWQKFLRLFFMSSGVGFTAAGIIFFFAYNWAQMHKFVKMGLIEVLILVLVGIVLFSKLGRDIKNMLLTGAAILVGVLFAVFGQIYQTGANAYDFFLSWTLFIALWVFVSNFAPLWLLFIALSHTTLFLYSEQVAHEWSGIFLCLLLFTGNTLFLSGFLFAKNRWPSIHAPTWFTHVLALASATLATIGMLIGIFDDFTWVFLLVMLGAFIFYPLGIWYGLKTKSGFYLSIILFSIIIVISGLLLKISDGAAMLLFMSLFIIASVTLVIIKLFELQKKWKR